MRLHLFSPFLALFLSACGGHAGAYLIEPAPVWAPSPAPAPLPTSEAALPLSGTAAISTAKPRPKVHGTETPTPTPSQTPTATLTATQVSGFYLVPFQDRRKEQPIWSGQSVYESVVMEPVGSTLLAQAWHQRPFTDMSYLWHRQFGYSLAENGYTVQSAALPVEKEADALAQAKEAGAKVLLSGTLLRLNIVKRGADDLLGTNFTGTNYFMNVQVKLRLLDVDSGRLLQERSIEEQRKFYDPTRLGSADRDTFPRFFATGLPELAVRVAGDVQLRAAAGLPTFTPTPTCTQTQEVLTPIKASEPSPVPTATPDLGPYWVNPKTGERVDPNWNFDPKDGTPRDKFVLRQPAAAPTPLRPTEAK